MPPAKRDPHRFDDLFAEFGPITLKRLFGGEGIWHGETMIGIVSRETIYLKTDDVSRQAFLAENCRPFAFKKHGTGETIATSWYALPDRLYDEPDQLARWARVAHGVASASSKAQREPVKKAPAKNRARR